MSATANIAARRKVDKAFDRWCRLYDKLAKDGLSTARAGECTLEMEQFERLAHGIITINLTDTIQYLERVSSLVGTISADMKSIQACNKEQTI